MQRRRFIRRGLMTAYSPELNPVERLWAYLKSHYLSNRIYAHYKHLFNETTKAWNQLTEEQFKSICNFTSIQHEN